jgi:type II secretory pathway component GspD/PulD (secretin)
MRLLALLFAAAFHGQAQSPPAEAKPAPPPVRRVIDVKHLSGDRAERAVRLVNQFMHPVGSINFDPVLRTAVIIGPEDVVRGAEALLAKFDSPAAIKPDSQVQFRIYLVEGSPDAAANGIVPTEIASAVEQMRKSFVYKGYRLLDTVLLQSRGSGGAESSGNLAVQTERPDVRMFYQLRIQAADVLEDRKTVAIRNFRFNLRTPIISPGGNVQFSETGINTDLTVQQGQKLVVGKLSSDKSQNAIFLIVTVDLQ